MKRIIIILLFFVSLTVHAQRGLYDLPDPYTDAIATSGSLAITRGGRLIVSNPYASRVSIINQQREIEAEFDIGTNPQGVAVVPDNLRIVAVSQDEGTLAIISLEDNTLVATYPVGDGAYAVVTDDDFAYISLQEANEVVIVQLEDGRVLERIATPENPSGLAKWGDFLYVTHFWTGELSMIYLPTAEVVRTIHPHPQGTLSASIELNPIDGVAYLPQTIANNSASATVDNRMIPVVHEVDLRTMQVINTINLAAADRNVSIPFAVRQPTNRSRLYVTHAGSDSVTILNLDTGVADNHFETGASPRGIVFSRDFIRIYIQDAIDSTVSVVDTAFFGLEDQIPSHTEAIPPAIQVGGRLFYSATDSSMSNNGLISCASCHWAGQSDNREWFDAKTPPLTETDSTDKDWLNQHIITTQGGDGLSVDSLDMTLLVNLLRGE